MEELSYRHVLEVVKGHAVEVVEDFAAVSKPLLNLILVVRVVLEEHHCCVAAQARRCSRKIGRKIVRVAIMQLQMQLHILDAIHILDIDNCASHRHVVRQGLKRY